MKSIIWFLTLLLDVDADDDDDDDDDGGLLSLSEIIFAVVVSSSSSKDTIRINLGSFRNGGAKGHNFSPITTVSNHFCVASIVLLLSFFSCC